MFTKVLKKSDIEERRVYLPAELAKKFGVLNGTQVSVCGTSTDQVNNIWQMKFIKRDGKSYLGNEWGEFIEKKGLRKGDTVNFYDLGPHGANGERLFKIERKGVAGIDLNACAFSNNN